jgi:hypothetical protein
MGSVMNEPDEHPINEMGSMNSVIRLWDEEENSFFWIGKAL